VKLIIGIGWLWGLVGLRANSLGDKRSTILGKINPVTEMKTKFKCTCNIYGSEMR